ncbi:MAG TPA: immunoglobulin domain-containing protein [Chlorobiota bacterium]|nr:immunoglobulin domain-containing protein [Chlorobiota bacterium]
MRVSATPGPTGQGYILNSGQWPSDVLALGRSATVDVWITTSGIILDQHVQRTTGPERSVVRATWQNGRVPSAVNYGRSIMQVSMIKGREGASTTVAVVDRVTVQDVIGGVDAVFTMTNGTPRFDLSVDAGVNVSSIGLTFAGSLERAENTVRLSTAVGSITLDQLVVEQGGRILPSSFKLQNSSTLSFDVLGVDPSQRLVIDPIVFGTYVGGAESDTACGIRRLANGNIIVAGSTFGIDFPTEIESPFKLQSAGGYDAFVAILDPTMSRVLQYTYVGGGSDDLLHAMTTDADGNVYIAGETVSNDFPVSQGSAGSFVRGGTEAFVAKLSPSLQNLLVGAYVAGNLNDIAYAVAVDQDQNIYVAGATTSTQNFPINAGYDRTPNGSWDGFLSKLSPSGASFVYSTYYGAEGNDYVYAMYVDASGNPFLAGTTTSPNFPTFPIPRQFSQNNRPYDRNFAGNSDAFIIRFGADGANLVYAGFAGGNADEEGRALFVDDAGRAYLVGETTSTDLPTTAGFRQQRIGGRDLFLFIVNDDGKELVGCTYFGGTGDDYIRAAVKDGTTGAIITGMTTSSNFQTEGIGSTSVRRGANDAFIANISLGACKWSSLISGGGVEMGLAVAADVNDDYYVAGVTTSADLALPASRWQQTAGGKTDGFVLKVAKGTLAMTAPQGNEQWCTSGANQITWAADGAPQNETFTIQTSSNNGTTWDNLATGLTTRQYTWRPTAFQPGSYRIRIVGARGHIAEVPQPVTLFAGPTITEQPVPVQTCVGQRVEFAITASGAELRYRWKKNGNVIPNATQATYVISSVTSADAGQYSCEVTGKCSPIANSTPAALSIGAGPSIATQPQSQEVDENTKVTFRVVAGGTGLTFQWKKDGAAIDGATTNELTIEMVKESNAGSYVVDVTSACGTTTSQAATLKVNKIMSVAFDGPVGGLAAGPLPVSDVLTVQFDGTGVTSIYLIDVLGRTVQQWGIGAIVGRSEADLDVSSVPAGSYILDVRSGTKRGVLTVSVSH